MQTKHRLIFIFTLSMAFLAAISGCEQQSLPRADVTSTLIRNVQIIDGTGAPSVKGAVRIDKGLIVELGDLDPIDGEIVVEGKGQVLAPGFIDTHSHIDWGLFERRDALEAVSQGITTAVIGQDGGSPFPLLDFRMKLLEQPVALNLASYSGHNTIRTHVMKDDFRRQATESEIRVMQQFLREDMQAGALGLGTGLEYDPGIYSGTEEVIELARVAKEFDGRYISHIRSEDRWFPAAVDEIIRIGREVGIPVQISHFKLAMTSLWGRADEFLARLDQARASGVEVTADVYPYEFWQSNMMVLLPGRDISDRAEVEFALREIAPPEGMWFSQFEPDPSIVGQTLAEVAVARSEEPADTFMSLLAQSEQYREETGHGGDNIIATSMKTKDIKALLAWPHSNVCTDGALRDPHPRGAGTFPKILGRWVREQDLMSLEAAVHKMTGKAAEHMGFADRGLIRPGAAADLVVFDPNTVMDHATPKNPTALSSGITRVWVNGITVYRDGEASGMYPGQFVSR